MGAGPSVRRPAGDLVIGAGGTAGKQEAGGAGRSRDHVRSGVNGGHRAAARSARPELVYHRHQKNLPCESCSKSGPSDTAGKNVSAPTIRITPSSSPPKIGVSVRKGPAPGATGSLAA